MSRPRQRNSRSTSDRNRRLRFQPLEERSVLSGFSFLDFATTSGLSIVGDAATTADNRLRLTPAASGMEGAAWYNAEKQFVGHEFSTTFQFQMTENADPPGGSDGFVFALQNTSPSFLSGGGGTLGYYDLANSLVVEFDTLQNSEASDPSGSHISIHTNGTGPNSWLESVSLGSYNTTPIMDDTAVHTARIAYSGGTLSVYLDDLQSPKLSVPIDLPSLLSLDAGRAWVGFTASTGGGWQNHDIMSWSFEAAPAIVIGDAIVTESADPLKILDRFVSQGSGGLDHPRGLAFGPDGNGDGSNDLYVASSVSHEVLRYNGVTGAFMDTFVAAASGGLAGPGDVAFGPDGNLYVSGLTSNNVLRYDGTSGAFLDVVADGLNGPLGLSFGSDGSLYIANEKSDEILRYDGMAVSTFIPAGSGGLDRPRHAVAGPDGNLYVASAGSQAVLRYDGSTGQFLDVFASTNFGTFGGPAWLEFSPDGYLYVTTRNGLSEFDTSLLRFDAISGAFVDSTTLGRDGWSFIIGPDNLIYNSGNGGGNFVELLGESDFSWAVFDVMLSSASASAVTVDFATANSSATAGSDYLAQSGTITFAPGQTSTRIRIAVPDDLLLEGNETFALNLSNATAGYPIFDSQGTATILDNEVGISIGDTTVVEGSSVAHYRGPAASDPGGGHFNSLTFGPDGNLYASVGQGSFVNTIKRYNGATGEFMGTFTSQGDLNGVRDMVFHSDGLLYVASANTDEVLRYDATTGAFVDVFVSANSGGIDHPDGMAFGPDANSDGKPELYVTGWLSHSVVRYDGATGQPLGTYIAAGSGGLSSPFALAFGPGGVYVTSAGTNQILKYDANTGAFLGVAAVAGLDYPRDVAFGADGLMYVTSGNNDRILRFTSAGVYVDDYVPAGAGGMDNPRSLVFGPAGDLYVTATGNDEILHFGSQAEAVLTVTLTNASSSAITVSFSTADGSALAGSDYVATSGLLTFAPGVTRQTILVPTLNGTDYETNETFTVNLSNANGATVVDGQGAVTILDDDPLPTKFYVVNDASTNATYEYTADGTAGENYSLNSGNATPRGAASTAAGDKVWVVDANRKVYVYNASGGLLGSWTAGTLASSANVQGIATNGTDVWIVDAKSDKVFKYTGAATRLSGSQNASSSFSLNSGNGSSTDIVTDGASFWVTNNASQNKVFKYTLGGSLLGSWTIDVSNATPMGITIDPSNVSDVWIVDSGTDRVYQYAGAASRTSGSQSAVASFALAAGNTNPQGIADPPVAIPDLSPTAAFPLEARESSLNPAVLQSLANEAGMALNLHRNREVQRSMMETSWLESPSVEDRDLIVHRAAPLDLELRALDELFAGL